LLDDDINTRKVPPGNADVAAFRAKAYPFTLNRTPAATGTAEVSEAYAHDEFGFAVLELVQDKGKTKLGYDASVFRIDASQSGFCRITLRPVRDIACSF
jgi:hypothetical protein